MGTIKINLLRCIFLRIKYRNEFVGRLISGSRDSGKNGFGIFVVFFQVPYIEDSFEYIVLHTPLNTVSGYFKSYIFTYITIEFERAVLGQSRSHV